MFPITIPAAAGIGDSVYHSVDNGSLIYQITFDSDGDGVMDADDHCSHLPRSDVSIRPRIWMEMAVGTPIKMMTTMGTELAILQTISLNFGMARYGRRWHRQ